MKKQKKRSGSFKRIDWQRGIGEIRENEDSTNSLMWTIAKITGEKIVDEIERAQLDKRVCAACGGKAFLVKTGHSNGHGIVKLTCAACGRSGYLVA